MAVDNLQPLLGRTLVLVAHPDDEAVTCGALLQRMREPMVVVATDGAPRDDYFWRQYGSRDAYAQLRRDEARQAAAAVDLSHLEFLASRENGEQFVDQELFRTLPDALHALLETIDRTQPSGLLTLAYEGGHPDHDGCSFLAHVAGHLRSLPVWEAPLYHRTADGLLVRLQFLMPDDSEVVVQPSTGEQARKQRMLAAYSSQAEAVALFTSHVERFRIQPAYDFTAPPHPGPLNYEAWRWSMNSDEVCAAFARCLSNPGVCRQQR